MNPEARRRPRVHFTPRQGWLNDPYGVIYADGRYHLFFQYNPAATVWDTALSWGHATSPDLVLWTEQPVALTPGPGEAGCWSGSVVTGPDGPTLFYTRMENGGQVARATSDDFATWRRAPAASVIAERPPGVVEMRDPAVRAAAGGWLMVLGARLAGGTGAVLQYSSPDTRTWSYDGVLTSGDGDRDEMWECPQFFPLGDAWVLIVSVPGGGVRYALGAYDGVRFAPSARGDFARGGRMYATTTFLDTAGRRCAMSWLRERDDAAPSGSPWSGALSVPWVLSVRGDRLLAAPHPDLDSYVVDGGTGLRVDGDRLVDGEEVLLDLPPGGEITVIADADLVEVAVEGVSGVATARRTGAGEAGARLLRFATGPGGHPDAHASS
jgi:beta-fructofuranosidase